MKWIKTYEDYKTRYQDVSYNPFYYYSDGSDGYTPGQKIPREKFLETFNKYNNLFKYLGICMNIKDGFIENGSEIPLSIDIVLNFLHVKLQGESDQTRTLFYNALYYISPENDKVITSVLPMVNIARDTNKLSELTIKFNFEHKYTNDINMVKSQRKGRDIRSLVFSVNRALTTEDNFMDIIMPQLFNYILLHMSDKVLMCYSVMGNKKVEIELPFIKKTIVRCLSNWKNLTIDNISKIAFEEISNSKDSHKIFNYMKSKQDIDNLVSRQLHKNWNKEIPIDWYDMFQKQDKEGLDKSSGMVDMGFAD